MEESATAANQERPRGRQAAQETRRQILGLMAATRGGLTTSQIRVQLQVRTGHALVHEAVFDVLPTA